MKNLKGMKKKFLIKICENFGITEKKYTDQFYSTEYDSCVCVCVCEIRFSM